MSGGNDDNRVARLVTFQRIDQQYKTARTVVRCVVAAFGLWQARYAIEALAGQTTSIYVHTILEVFADLRFYLAFALAGGMAAWAVVERILRQRAIVRLHTRIKELETKADPERSSSGLTEKGQTNPRDRGL